MKKIAAFFAVLICLYSIYYDMTVGTVPLPKAAASQQPEGRAAEDPFRIVTVSPGDTVLTIIERESGAPVPVPIETAVEDFRKLNPQADPQFTQPGQAYRFPVYGAEGR